MHAMQTIHSSRPCRTCTHTTLALINGGRVCTLTSHQSARALRISPGGARLFSGVDRMVIKNRARSGLLPKLSTSAAPPLAEFPCPESLSFPCWACRPFTHQRPRGLWKAPMCQYQSTNGSHVFAEWKKPSLFRIQTCLAINGSEIQSLFFFFFECFSLLSTWLATLLTVDNAILDDPSPMQEGPFPRRQRKQLRVIECNLLT